MKHLIHPLVLILILSLLAGCGNESSKNEDAKQEKHTSLTNTPFDTTANGLQYIIHTDLQGVTPEKGDIVRTDILIRTKERHLMNTFVEDKSYFFEVQEPQFRGDIAELLPKLTKGDSVTTKAEAQQIYKGRVPPQIGRYDTVYTYLKVKGIFNEKEALLSHIDATDENVDTLDEGLYVNFEEEGTGRSIQKGDSVVLELKGQLMDGTVFRNTREENRSYGFVYGNQDLLPGIDTVVSLSREGTKVKVYMVSRHGYGPGGARPLILPFSPLIYDIEVKAVYRAPA